MERESENNPLEVNFMPLKSGQRKTPMNLTFFRLFLMVICLKEWFKVRSTIGRSDLEE